MPIWVILAAHAAIALGTLAGGWRIIHTMGSKITKLTPVGGFAAETGAAIAVLTATYLGVGVSTTHAITGAIVGVGATRRLSAVRWGVAGQIVWAWILTIPAAFAIAAAMCSSSCGSPARSHGDTTHRLAQTFRILPRPARRARPQRRALQGQAHLRASRMLTDSGSIETVEYARGVKRRRRKARSAFVVVPLDGIEDHLIAGARRAMSMTRSSYAPPGIENCVTGSPSTTLEVVLRSLQLVFDVGG